MKIFIYPGACYDALYKAAGGKGIQIEIELSQLAHFVKFFKS